MQAESGYLNNLRWILSGSYEQTALQQMTQDHAMEVGQHNLFPI